MLGRRDNTERPSDAETFALPSKASGTSLVLRETLYGPLRVFCILHQLHAQSASQGLHVGASATGQFLRVNGGS